MVARGLLQVTPDGDMYVGLGKTEKCARAQYKGGWRPLTQPHYLGDGPRLMTASYHST